MGSLRKLARKLEKTWSSLESAYKYHYHLKPGQDSGNKELDNILASSNASTIYWVPEGHEGPPVVIKRVFRETESDFSPDLD
jgi:hypothetical protein